MQSQVVASVLPAQTSPQAISSLYTGGKQFLVDPRILTPHPRNLDFFDDITGDKWSDFVQSIRENGVLTPLLVTDGRLIISGHQRWRAAMELEMTSIPVIECRFKDDDDALRALIETNIRQRGTLNQSQFKQARIIKELERLYNIKQGKGGDTTKKQCSNEHCSPEDDPPSTRKELAQSLGVSESQYTRIKSLANIIPGLADILEENIVPRNIAYVLARNLSELEQRDLMDSLLRLPVFKNRNQRFIEAGIKEGMESEYQQRDAIVQEIKDKLAAAEAAKQQSDQDASRLRREAMDMRKELSTAKAALADRPQEMKDLENLNRDLTENLVQSRNSANLLKQDNARLQKQLDGKTAAQQAELAWHTGISLAAGAVSDLAAISGEDPESLHTIRQKMRDDCEALLRQLDDED